MLKICAFPASPIIKQTYIHPFCSNFFLSLPFLPEGNNKKHIKIASYSQKNAFRRKLSQHFVAFIHTHLISHPIPPTGQT
jgi:hypothetical protein